MQSLRIAVLALILVALTACGTQATAAPSLPTVTSPSAVAAPSPTTSAKIVVNDIRRTGNDSLLVSLHKSGGIAGINETLTVYVNGRVELEDRNGQLEVGQVSDTDLQMLRSLLDSPEMAQTREEYELSGADLRFYEITLRSSGKLRTITTMDAAGHPEVIGQLMKELARLRPTSR